MKTKTNTKTKSHPMQALGKHLADARRGKKVVHCHGVFDLLHIGHIRHLEQAKKMGDLLVVTLTADAYVNKGPNRPAFPQQLRAEALAALDCVDFVAINEAPMAIEAINAVRPDYYVKGSDYRVAKDDHTGGILKEREAVEAFGGRLVFTDDITYSSSRLINQHMDMLPPTTRSYLDDFATRHPIKTIINGLNSLAKLKVLVIGDAIIDEYQYCQAIGKSSKEPVLAVKQGESEQFAGGALAVANHVAGFCGNVGLLTALGKQNDYESFIRAQLAGNVWPTFCQRDDAPTIVKRRFIDQYFFQKLFETYDINDSPLTGEVRQVFLESIAQMAPQHDLVIVMDFGHGLLDEEAIDLLTNHAKFLAVNAQSNAGNLGYHTISLYPRADLVCITENELRLDARDRHGDLEPLIEQASARMGGAAFAVTRGAQGCLTYSQRHGFAHVPAVATSAKDRVGAGDAFLSVAAPCVARGAAMEIVGLVGNAAGAQAINTVGHRESAARPALIKQIECLLK